MLLIGSKALAKHINVSRKMLDTDYIATYDEYRNFVKNNPVTSTYPLDGNHMIVKCGPDIYEFEIAWENSSAADILSYEKDNQYASLSTLRMIKESHKYKRNSPHFLKTLRDLQTLRPITKLDSEQKAILKKREKETYNYSHPKLNQSKMGFFTDSVNYVYDHDSIHESVKHLDRPAYTYYMVDGEEVLTSKKKFNELPHLYKLYGVLEESYVLALERSQIPNNFSIDRYKSFSIALSKVCTSITSGWFRKFAYDNYDSVVALYDSEYVDQFKESLDAGRILPFRQA